MVLLRNDGVLPLSVSTRLALLGNSSYGTFTGGTGSGDVNEAYAVSLLQGLKAAGATVDGALAATYTPATSAEKEAARHATAGSGCRRRSPRCRSRPTRSPGWPARRTSRSDARSQLRRVRGPQAGERLRALGDRESARTGRRRRLPRPEEEGRRRAERRRRRRDRELARAGGRAPAGLAARAGGGARDRGRAAGSTPPSGKLATTFPVRWEDVPSSANFPGKTLLGPDPNARGPMAAADRAAEVAYEDDIWVGYRHFATKGVKTAYPFGFGLSYTDFRYADLKLSGNEFERELTASVTITNRGPAAGREVVQLYLSAPGGTAPKPALELKGFAKTRTLKPGEAEILKFTLTARDLASFDATSSTWQADAGTYTLKIGASSEDIRLSAPFRKAGEEKVASVSTAVGPRPVSSSARGSGESRAVAALLALCLGGGVDTLAGDMTFVDPFVARTRVLILTDIANEPDDQMSLVRFLVYSNQFDVEGLVATHLDLDEGRRSGPTSSAPSSTPTRRCSRTCSQHAPGFPTAAALRAVVAPGSRRYGMAVVGEDKSSPGAELIAPRRRQGRRAAALGPRLGRRQHARPGALARALHADAARRSRRSCRSCASTRSPTRTTRDPGSVASSRALHYIATPSTQDGEEYYFATWTGISGDRFYRNCAGRGLHHVLRRVGRREHPQQGTARRSSTPSPAASTRATRRRSSASSTTAWPSAMSPAYGGWGGRYVWRRPHGRDAAVLDAGRRLVPRPGQLARHRGRRRRPARTPPTRPRSGAGARRSSTTSRRGWTGRSRTPVGRITTRVVVVNGRPGTAPLELDALVGDAGDPRRRRHAPIPTATR